MPANERPAKSPVLGAVKAVVLAFMLSLILTAAAALLLFRQALPLSAVRVVTPVIKAVSALAAGCLGTARVRARRWLAGGAAACCYILVTELVFMLLAGGVAFRTGVLADLAMCFFAGVLGGMLQSLRGE